MTSPDILVAGETLIDFLPEQRGPLSSVETFTRRAGGAAANVAIALARLDARPWFLANISNDGFGDFLAATLDREGIPSQFVERDSDHKTTLAFVAHDERADRSFTFYGTDTADHYIDADTVSNEVLESVQWVCVDAPVALAAEPARSALLDLCERAHEHGCRVVFDPNTRRELWPDEETYLGTLEAMLSQADVVKTSTDDLAGTPFASDDPSDLAENLFDAGPHTVFLTQGTNGASVFADKCAPRGPAKIAHAGYSVKSVDTTGAGDAFLAGALCALANGEPFEETLEFANAVAALTTTEAGAITALPDHEMVVEFRKCHSKSLV